MAPDGTAFSVRVRRLTVVLLVVNVALCVVSLLSRVVAWSETPMPRFLEELLHRVNVDAELTVPAWYSCLILALLAGCSLLIALAMSRGTRWRGTWFAISAIVLVLSIDEASAIHEIALRPTQRILGIVEGPFLFAWVVPALALVVLVLALLARFFLALPRGTQLGGALGVGLYLLGALGMEMLAGALVYRLAVPGTGSSLSLDAIATVEELLEMTGVVVLIRTLLRHLERHVLGGEPLRIAIG